MFHFNKDTFDQTLQKEWLQVAAFKGKKYRCQVPKNVDPKKKYQHRLNVMLVVVKMRKH